VNENTNWPESGTNPNLRMKQLRGAEYGLVVLWLWGLVVTGQNERWDFYRLPSACWVGLLTLAIWTGAPILMRPLTTPGVTPQQRYAVGALILGAGLAWLVWLRETLDDNDPSGLGILTTVGLVAVAGFLRLGWKKGPQP